MPFQLTTELGLAPDGLYLGLDIVHLLLKPELGQAAEREAGLPKGQGTSVSARGRLGQ